jgi:hypothetical protein
MGKPIVGEVVVLPFPQSDLQTGKRRPGLVVANLKGDDLIPLPDYLAVPVRWLFPLADKIRFSAGQFES